MSAKRKKTEDAANQFVVTREEVVIPPPNFKIGHFKLIGVSPLVINRFSEKAKAEIRAKHEKGKRASKAKRDQPPRDFKADYEAAKRELAEYNAAKRLARQTGDLVQGGDGLGL